MLAGVTIAGSSRVNKSDKVAQEPGWHVFNLLKRARTMRWQAAATRRAKENKSCYGRGSIGRAAGQRRGWRRKEVSLGCRLSLLFFLPHRFHCRRCIFSLLSMIAFAAAGRAWLRMAEQQWRSEEVMAQQRIAVSVSLLEE